MDGTNLGEFPGGPFCRSAAGSPPARPTSVGSGSPGPGRPAPAAGSRSPLLGCGFAVGTGPARAVAIGVSRPSGYNGLEGASRTATENRPACPGS